MNKMSVEEVMDNLTEHLQFFEVSLNNPVALANWLRQPGHEQFQEPIDSLSQLIIKELGSVEQYQEFIDAIKSGDSQLAYYLIRTRPNMATILETHLSSVIDAAIQWANENVFDEDIRDVDTLNLQTEKYLMSAIENLKKLRELYPKSGKVGFVQFMNLFFFENTEGKVDVKKVDPVITIVSLLEEYSSRDSELFDEMAEREVFVIEPNTLQADSRGHEFYNTMSVLTPVGHLAARMHLNKAEFMDKLKFLGDLKTMLSSNLMKLKLELVSPESKALYLKAVQDLPTSLTDLNDYIKVNEAYSAYLKASDRQYKDLKMLEKLLNDPEFRKNYSDGVLSMMSECVKDIPKEINTSKEAAMIILLHSRAYSICKTANYPLIQTVQEFIDFLDPEDKKKLCIYGFIDDKFQVNNLQDLSRVHQLYNVLSSSDSIRPLMLEMLELKNKIDVISDKEVKGEILKEINLLFAKDNPVRSSVASYKAVYDWVETYRTERNGQIYGKLCQMAERFPVPPGLKMQDIQNPNLSQQQLSDINQSMALIQKRKFTEKDYEKLFLVKPNPDGGDRLLDLVTTKLTLDIARVIDQLIMPALSKKSASGESSVQKPTRAQTESPRIPAAFDDTMKTADKKTVDRRPQSPSPSEPPPGLGNKRTVGQNLPDSKSPNEPPSGHGKKG